MGVFDIEVSFDKTAPESSQIIDAVSAVSGLAAEWVCHEDPDDDLHDLIGEVRFVKFPDSWVELHTYRAGAVRKSLSEAFDDDSYPLADQFQRQIQGFKEPAGTQTVYLRGYLLSEPTLLIATMTGLEELGGKVVGEPFSDQDLADFSLPVTVEQLQTRQAAAAKNAGKVLLANLAWCVVVGPFWLLGTLLSLPFEMWRAWRMFGSK